MEAIRIRYNRSVTNGQETTEVGGEWEFQMTTLDSFEDEYRKAYYMVQGTIDKLMVGISKDIGAKEDAKEVKAPQPIRTFTPQVIDHQEELPTVQVQGQMGEYRIFEPGESTMEIIDNQPVHLPRSRVWDIKPGKTSNGKPYIAVRVGNLDHIPTKNGYARVKSFEPNMISKLEALEMGEYVNLWGHYQSWQGNEGTMWDFVPERVEKVN